MLSRVRFSNRAYDRGIELVYDLQCVNLEPRWYMFLLEGIGSKAVLNTNTLTRLIKSEEVLAFAYGILDLSS